MLRLKYGDQRLSSEFDLARLGRTLEESVGEPPHKKPLRVWGVDALGLFWPRTDFGAGHCRRGGSAPRYGDSAVAAGCSESFVRTREDTGGGAAAGDRVLERGCLRGAIALPADGPNWQVMRPSRDRAWGHPVLIAFLERLAQKLPGEASWPRLLVGDVGQPRGGPMLTGHQSHQIGLDGHLQIAGEY